MRQCRRNNIPVPGIPLNANRCIRWYGEFFQNSIDLDELEKLLKAWRVESFSLFSFLFLLSFVFSLLAIVQLHYGTIVPLYLSTVVPFFELSPPKKAGEIWDGTILKEQSKTKKNWNFKLKWINLYYHFLQWENSLKNQQLRCGQFSPARCGQIVRLL